LQNENFKMKNPETKILTFAIYNLHFALLI